MNRQNVYENSPGSISVESERLRTFDIPTQLSVEAIGDLAPGAIVLDIGGGENPGLNNFVQNQDAKYVAFDIRHDALAEQKERGAFVVEGDARSLPFANDSVDVAHARFVLAHFSSSDRSKMIDEAIRCVKPGGKSVLIDYDWTAMNGSEAINKLRDFTIDNIHAFDASYGAHSTTEIDRLLPAGITAEELRQKSPIMEDYTPVIGLRQITLRGLEASQADEELIAEANSIFDALEEEARSDNPPGFYMPDMVATIVRKPTILK